ncbi:MAG: FG-GAP-like repeat-containing protein [bacterium]|nr:FG-GAP-like repeat-containing protein [bacterium]
MTRWKSAGILLLLCLMVAIPPAAYPQGLVWERQIPGYLEGTQMAFYHGGMDYSKPVLADLDNDGAGELYVGEHDGYIDVFENLGGNPANWQCITTALDSIDVGKHAAPAFWDIDLDGDLDLFVGNESGVIAFYRNDGTPSAPVWTLVSSTYANLRVPFHAIPFFKDVDSDGLADLLVGNNSGGAVFFKNVGQPGNPSWSYQTQFYQGINLTMKSSVCVFDLNADSLQDVIMSALAGDIYYYRNNGPAPSPSYTNMGILGSANHNGVPTFWDLDGDNDLDLISGESDGNLDVWNNTGNAAHPRFEFSQNTLAYFDVGLLSKPALADIDDDGDLDLFIGRHRWGITYLENIGTPDSAAWHRVADNYANINFSGDESLVFNDIDNDGDLDLLIGLANGTLAYYRNSGTPQAPVWVAPVLNYTGVDVGNNASPAFADLDGDGDLDLFVGSESGAVRYLRRVGSLVDPVWQDLGNIPAIDVGNYSTPFFTDIDADGDSDMVIGCGNITGWLNLYTNIGGPYQSVWAAPVSPWNDWDFGDDSAPVFADLNDDGRVDLLVGCESGGLYLFNNLGPLHDIDLTLIPINPPIQIPRVGGSFSYNFDIQNGESPFTGQIWCNILMPDSSVFGPVMGPDEFSLPANANLIRHRTQVVLGISPPGIYIFNGYVGLYPDSIWTHDSFPFEKTTTGDGPMVTGDWANYGEPLDGWLPLQHASIPCPQNYSLETASPNPFNPSTTLTLNLPEPALVTLAIYDVNGRKIADLLHGWRDAGRHEVVFEANNLPSGIYLARCEAGHNQSTQKLVLLK